MLRTKLLDPPYNTPSLPLDIGYSENIPAHIRRAIADGQHNADGRRRHSLTQLCGSKSRVSLALDANQRRGATTIFSAEGLSQAPHQLSDLLAMI